MSQTILFLLLNGTGQTLWMVVAATSIALTVGLPLGIILCITRKGFFSENLLIHRLLAIVVNTTRSIPFIILMIAVIPFTRLIIGTSIGTGAAIVPLSLCAMPFIARVVENALLEVQPGLIEAATAMGASASQIITKVLLPEALPSIINGITLTTVNLVGYSAMAGAVGGGGLGDIAIRYGYQRFDINIMLVTIFIMIVIVQAIQMLGDSIVKKLIHCRQ